MASSLVSRHWVSGAIASLLTLCAIPLVTAMILSAHGIYTLRNTGDSWQRTVEITTVAALATTVLGSVLGTYLMHLSTQYRLLGLGILSLPALLPNYVWAIAWSGVLSSHLSIGRGAATLSRPAIVSTVWVWVATQYPWAMGLTYLVLRLWSRKLSEVAHACGLSPRWERLIRYRLLMASSAAAFVIVWLLVVSDFAVPDYFRLPLFANDIFVNVSSYLDTSAAAASAFPILVIAVVLSAYLATLARRQSWIENENEGHQNSATGHLARHSQHARVIAISALLGAALIFVGLPLVSLVVVAGGAGAIVSAWPVFVRDLGASVALAGIATFGAVILGALVGYDSVRGQTLLASFARTFSLLAFSLPSSILGLVAIMCSNHGGFLGWLYTSGGVLVLALVTKYVVVVVEGARAQFSSVAPGLEEIAMANGTRPWQVAWNIDIPLVARGLAFGAGVFALLVMNDLTLPALLAPPGLSTLPLTVFSTVHYGPASLLAALCIWQAALVLAIWGAVCGAAILLESRRH